MYISMVSVLYSWGRVPSSNTGISAPTTPNAHLDTVDPFAHPLVPDLSSSDSQDSYSKEWAVAQILHSGQLLSLVCLTFLFPAFVSAWDQETTTSDSQMSILTAG